MKNAAFAGFAIAAAITLGVCGPLPAEPAPPPPGPVVGQIAPGFDLPTIDGKRVTLASLRGKTVVVNSWATWCPPCRLETPDLIAAHKELAGPDVVFVGIDSSEKAPLVKAFVAAKNIGWTQAIDDGSFSKAYDIRYFPTTFVIDPQGILRTTYVDTVTTKMLAGFVDDAKAGRNGHIESAAQAKIDALLAPAQYPLAGDEPTIVASVEKIRKAIDDADKLVDDSDPAEGNPVDLTRTQAEESALRVAAIAALAPLATTPDRKLTLALLQGDENWYKGDNAAALAAYRSAAELDPKSQDAWAGVEQSARRLKEYATMIVADERLVELDPTVTTLVDVGIDYGIAGKIENARETFDRAVALQIPKASAPGAKPVEIRRLAWAYLYYGRTEAKHGSTQRARRQFALAAEWAQKLPKNDSRYAIYNEQAQEETVALDLGSGSRTTTTLSVAPWTGPELPGSVPNTAKYRLVVAGPEGKSVALHAADLPKGWIASFCTDRICAPMRVTTTLPASGVKVIEFQVVPPETKALAHLPSVRVVATDGRSTTTVTTIALR
ncbi:MAG: redoxin domain-containing protein [Candidatus Eremiobacteraeota bacterium]|nr:redoxin domain-containing protein [Candidatus Eremiobacteraeota bacterium]